MEKQQVYLNEVMTMDNETAARDLLIVAKQLFSARIPIATNYSWWQWEYDQDGRTATVYVDEASGRLSFDIIGVHTKTGLGAGKQTEVLDQGDLGTVSKPRLGGLASALKKFGHDRSRSGRGFKRLWTDRRRSETKLKSIIEEYRLESGPAAVSVISDRDKKQMILQKIQGLSGRQLDEMMKALNV